MSFRTATARTVFVGKRSNAVDQAYRAVTRIMSNTGLSKSVRGNPHN